MTAGAGATNGMPHVEESPMYVVAGGAAGPRATSPYTIGAWVTDAATAETG
eukprot:CAMPEP_0194501726 /NCGR_PEP_ID=MMETSP0253-20130528/22893_1 /TAXON_ID=2966 /ORGANISM="Noctiluca scintillans" /LENGTH=50 /DNA_ID=CAMNT_0039343745 /DNA_START=19 /DNA_END=171 /DNA_ORIENTATION=-